MALLVLTCPGWSLSSLIVTKKSDRLHLADIIGLIVCASIISVYFYHPFYFGDELTAFFRDPETRTFSNVFFDFSTYKPRLIFNALWAAYGACDVSRIVPMLANLLFLWGGACVLYAICRNKFSASRVTSLLSAIVYMTGRFGLMLHFDYLSGNIETLSALLFFVSIYFSLGFVGEDSGRPAHLVVIVLAATAMVFVHERYIVAALVLGSMVALSALRAKRYKYLVFITGIFIALFPGGVFFIAGKLLTSMAISTGTAGQPISVGIDTFTIFARYLCNVLFGTNFGLPWFVGGLSIDEGIGRYLIPALATILIFAWVNVIAFRRDVRWLRVMLLFGLVLALIAVAALPGADKQESRWMFPVAALLCLLVVSIGRAKGVNLILSVFLFANAVYYFTGSYKSIFNVESSIEAKAFGEAFSQVDWAGSPGVLLDAPEPQASWWLGGDTILGNDGKSGLVFCRANFEIESACMFPPSAAAGGVERFSFGLKFERHGSDAEDGPVFSFIGKDELIADERLNQAIVDAVSRSESSPSVVLEINPSLIDACKSGGSAENVVVNWSVADGSVGAITIWLVPTGADPVLFSTGGSVGVAETGRWVDSEISFVMMDSGTKKMLGAKTVKRRECP
ncbi:MAG: hypothetical protein ACN6RK_06350 [Stenotrophomonas sp.]